MEKHKKKPPSSPSAPRDPLYFCFSHQRLPDKWVHQGEHWDMVPWMGHVARARGGDTFSPVCISIHARGRVSVCHLTMCKCVTLLVYGLWQRWWVSLSSLIAAPADGRGLWQEEKSVRNLTPGSAMRGRGEMGVGEWSTCAPHKAQFASTRHRRQRTSCTLPIWIPISVGWWIELFVLNWLGEWSKYTVCVPVEAIVPTTNRCTSTYGLFV